MTTHSLKLRVENASENAVIAYFGDALQNHSGSDTPSPVSAHISIHIQRIVELLRQQYAQRELIDLVPSYASLLVIFDPLTCDHPQVHDWLYSAASEAVSETKTEPLQNTQEMRVNSGKLVELPVYYSVESGPDLARVAEHSGLTIEQVIALHQASTYRVFAIGFAPGFAYLGELNQQLATPRHATPRQQVPQGAVAIADRQTAVYPASSPGGWNLLGLCPIPMFDPDATPTMPISVGDSVRFTAISKSTFLDMGGQLPTFSPPQPLSAANVQSKDKGKVR